MLVKSDQKMSCMPPYEMADLAFHAPCIVETRASCCRRICTTVCLCYKVKKRSILVLWSDFRTNFGWVSSFRDIYLELLCNINRGFKITCKWEKMFCIMSLYTW